MNDFLSINDRAILETELALLCSRIQLYYLIRWRVWRNRDICKMDEARRRLMLFSDMRSEFIARLVGSRPYEPYVLLSMLYRQELALVEYILDKYPDLMLMPEQEMIRVMEEAEKEIKPEQTDTVSLY